MQVILPCIDVSAMALLQKGSIVIFPDSDVTLKWSFSNVPISTWPDSVTKSKSERNLIKTSAKYIVHKRKT